LRGFDSPTATNFTTMRMIVLVCSFFLLSGEEIELKGREFEVLNAAGTAIGWTWEFSREGRFVHRHGERKVSGSWVFTGRSLTVWMNDSWRYRVSWNDDLQAVQLDFKGSPTFYLVEAEKTSMAEAEAPCPKF